MINTSLKKRNKEEEVVQYIYGMNMHRQGTPPGIVVIINLPRWQVQDERQLVLL